MLHSFWEPGPNHRESKRLVSAQGPDRLRDPTHTPGGPQIASDAGPGPDTPSGTAGPRVLSRGAAEPELGGRLPRPSSRSAAFPGREEDPKRVTGSPHHLTGTRRLGRARRGVNGACRLRPRHTAGGGSRPPKARRRVGKGGMGQPQDPERIPGRRRRQPCPCTSSVTSNTGGRGPGGQRGNTRTHVPPQDSGAPLPRVTSESSRVFHTLPAEWQTSPRA